jgi:hypothetical protein
MTDNDDITIRQKRMDDAKLQEVKGPPWRMWPDLKEGTVEKALREGRVKVEVTAGRTRAVTIKSKLKRRIIAPR